MNNVWFWGVEDMKRCDAAGSCQLPLEPWLPERWDPGTEGSLTPEMRRKARAGVRYKGNLARLQAALQRKKAGKGFTLAAVGGSMTAELGGMIGAMQERFFNFSSEDFTTACTGDCTRRGWLLPAFELLTRQGAPDALHNLVNCGLREGDDLQAYLSCSEPTLPMGADVIIYDGAMSDAAPWEQERLMRRLLQLPRHPAIIMLHMYDGCSSRTQTVSTSSAEGLPCSKEAFSAASVRAARYEEKLDALATRYGIPVLSARRAYFDGSRGIDALRRLTADGLRPRVCAAWAQASGDPGSACADACAKDRAVAFSDCRYLQMVGLLLTSYLQTALATLDRREIALGRGALPIPPLACMPLYARARETDGSAAHCRSWGGRNFTGGAACRERGTSAPKGPKGRRV